jgi:hypothetical protein
MKVYNIKFHAVEEALIKSIITLNSTKHINIYIDNWAAIQALKDKKDNSSACCKATYHIKFRQN